MAYSEDVTLVSSRTDTTTVSATAGTAIIVDTYRRGCFYLDATISGTVTLVCVIQTLIGGLVWTDFARFTNLTSTGTRVMLGVGIERNNGSLDNESNAGESAKLTGTITSGTYKSGPWGTQLRAYFTVTITGSGSCAWSCKGTVQS